MLQLIAIAQSRRNLDERGASMVEYAFLMGLIAIVVIAGAILLGTELNDKFSDVGNTMASY